MAAQFDHSESQFAHARTPDGKAAQRHAFIGNEALGRLLVQMVTDPQAQFVADAAEIVRKIAAVDRRDQDLLVGLIIRVRPQHSVEFGVRAAIEREGAVFVAVGVFEVEAAFSGREPVPGTSRSASTRRSSTPSGPSRAACPGT